MIDASQRAYDTRDELQEKIAALRERMARESREHEAGWKEQVKVGAGERAKGDYQCGGLAPSRSLTPASQLLEEESKARARQHEGEKRGGEGGSPGPARRDLRENKAKVGVAQRWGAKAVAHGWRADLTGREPHRRAQAMWDIARREVDLQRQRKRVHELEDAFGKIQRETGIESVDAMVEAFVESEERNFSVITMINELHKEAEGLERECEGMRAQAARLRGEDREADVARRQVFDELQRRVARLKRASDAHRRRHDEATTLVDELKPAVWAIFELVGCDNPTLAAQLAAAGVTDSNLLEFLGVIEQRVTEILHMQHLYLSAAPTQMLQVGGGPGGAPLPALRACPEAGELSTAAHFAAGPPPLLVSGRRLRPCRSRPVCLAAASNSPRFRRWRTWVRGSRRQPEAVASSPPLAHAQRMTRRASRCGWRP